ncbi:hypothetical protein Acid345_3849 [Candidatus Koribacter versatilis Ellin345]|uniref:DUF4142 domain-containing protein n=1 Tax=Koribacter versatilis (strain Ellin345) TaxID=204669 RepID=Q1IJV1_KORVE|nr:hypothetical protein [Candidatus Koribacter versatilis]ABF42849.1 hypothetical protein Acid345_3849 [Candidatus Koribacter versatilis Ellin345]
MSPSKSVFLCVILALASACALAQSDPSAALNSLEQTARNSVGDLQHLRVEKWKADGNVKKAAQSDSDSIQRNMTSALPELIAGVRSNPQNLNANFKLYRNLNVLYEVFARFAETAGAFGAREEYEVIAKDLDGIDSARRALADRMDTLTTSAETELTQFRSQAKSAQTAVTTAPPKKIVIDDSVQEKKPAAKKKAKPATTAPTTGDSSASSAPK